VGDQFFFIILILSGQSEQFCWIDSSAHNYSTAEAGLRAAVLSAPPWLSPILVFLFFQWSSDRIILSES